MMKNLLFTSASMLFLSSALCAQSTYSAKVIQCGQYNLRPEGMNNQGVVVGGAQLSTSPNGFGFLVYPGGTCKTTPVNGTPTSFLGITNSGGIIGLYTQSQDYLLQSTGASLLPAYPSGVDSYINYINKAGVLAGNHAGTLTIERYGFFYKNGKFTDLPKADSLHVPTLQGLNDAGIIVGTYNSFNIGAFIFQNGTMSFLEYPGATTTTFNGINNNNLIVGTYFVASTGLGNIFTYDMNTQTWTDLKLPSPYDASVPVGITDAGVIAAQYTAPGGLVIFTPGGN